MLSFTKGIKLLTKKEVSNIGILLFIFTIRIEFFQYLFSFLCCFEYQIVWLDMLFYLIYFDGKIDK